MASAKRESNTEENVIGVVGEEGNHQAVRRNLLVLHRPSAP